MRKNVLERKREREEHQMQQVKRINEEQAQIRHMLKPKKMAVAIQSAIRWMNDNG